MRILLMATGLSLVLGANLVWAGSMSERAQAAITANPHEKVRLIVTYRHAPDLIDEDPVFFNPGQSGLHLS